MRTPPTLFFILSFSLFSTNTAADDSRPTECECYRNIRGIKTAQIDYDAAFDKYVEVSSWKPSSNITKTQRSWSSGTGFDTLGWGPGGDDPIKVRGRYKVTVATDGSDFTAYATCPTGSAEDLNRVVELTATKSAMPDLPDRCEKKPEAESAESAPRSETTAVRNLTMLTAAEKQGLVNIIDAVKASILTNSDTTPTLLAAGLGYLMGKEIFVREVIEVLGPKDLALGDQKLTSAIQLCRRAHKNPRDGAYIDACAQWRNISPNKDLFETVRSTESSDCSVVFEVVAHASFETRFKPFFIESAQRCGAAIGIPKESIFPFTPAELEHDARRLRMAAHNSYTFDFMLHAVRYLNSLPCETANCEQVSNAAIQQLEESIGFRLHLRLTAERTKFEEEQAKEAK